MPLKKHKLGKDPDIDTSFLPDRYLLIFDCFFVCFNLELHVSINDKYPVYYELPFCVVPISLLHFTWIVWLLLFFISVLLCYSFIIGCLCWFCLNLEPVMKRSIRRKWNWRASGRQNKKKLKVFFISNRIAIFENLVHNIQRRVCSIY